MPSDPCFLGIEIGGTKLQLGLGFGDGRIVSLIRHQVDPHRGARGILDQIRVSIAPLIAQHDRSLDRLDAVGVGFGGPVDPSTGIAIQSNHVGGWEDFPLSTWIRENLGVPLVAIENDAATAGLGEATFGAGIGLSPLLYVTIGSGIGGGLICNGSIYRGHGPAAAEIGQLRIGNFVHGRPIQTRELGHIKTVEDLASGWAIGRHGRNELIDRLGQEARGTPLELLANGEPDQVTAFTVAEAARQGDLGALSILDAAAFALAKGLAHAVTLVSPRRIILGGGVSLIGEDLWYAPVRRCLGALVFPPLRSTFDLTAPALGEQVVVHGAIALACAALNRV